MTLLTTKCQMITLLFFCAFQHVNPYQMNGNGAGGGVSGARARNSSIPLRSVLINQPNEESDANEEQGQCEYCEPRDCLNNEEEETMGESPNFAYCYVEKDKETGTSNTQRCLHNEAILRRLAIGDVPDRQQQGSGCLPSKRSGFISICWCFAEGGAGSGDDEPKSNDQPNSRLSFNSGRRGGLQVVRLQSAEDARASGEPLLLKSRSRLDTVANNSGNSSGITAISIHDRSAVASRLSSASKPIAQRPPIQTIPRRPSPQNNAASDVCKRGKLGVLPQVSLLLAILASVLVAKW